MKVKSYIYLMMVAMALTSCRLEVPEIPAEELYLRNFIKTFGLIDPNQDWNLSERSGITINLPHRADKVVVYGQIFDEYYRVARCYNAEAGVMVIPLDVPVNTTGLAVEVDGVAYLAELNGTLDVTTEQPISRADAMPQNIFLDEENVLGWVIVSEDLGDTDDVDFNDFVARFEYRETSFYAYGKVVPDQWDVIEQQGTPYFKLDDDGDSGNWDVISRAGETSGNTIITIKPLAAGGILPIYLHYRNSSDVDYLIGPGPNTLHYDDYPDYANYTDLYEWHSWFGRESGVMLNTADKTYLSPGDHCYEDEKFVTEPISGGSIDFTVDGTFTFTDYSQMTYESFNPLDDMNFDFSRYNIKGFYITVNSPAYDASNPASNPAFDLGKVIGHNRSRGLPPQMMIVPDLCYVKSGEGAGTQVGTKQNHFKWPTERTRITNSYPEFAKWVSDGKTSWYQYGREDLVVSDDFLDNIYGNN